MGGAEELAGVTAAMVMVHWSCYCDYYDYFDLFRIRIIVRIVILRNRFR